MEPDSLTYRFNSDFVHDYAASSRREWILTNGTGAYAMGTLAGANTRRYHGLLVASDEAMARTVLLDNIEAFVEMDGYPMGLSTNQYVGALHPEGYRKTKTVEISNEAVEWVYGVGHAQISKRLVLAQGENAVSATYTNIGDRPVKLTLRPLVCEKPYHENFVEHAEYPAMLTFPKSQTVVQGPKHTLHLTHEGARRVPVQGWYYRFEHHREIERGLDPRDDLFCPCELAYELAPGEEAVLIASAQAATKVREREMDSGDRLDRAAAHFTVEQGRSTIVAGYPWFTDWGRDTMISLPGLLCRPEDQATARRILTTFSDARDQGIIPNRFVETGDMEFNTVDATLWMVNAVYSSLVLEWDRPFAVQMLESIADIVDWHFKGTHYGIHVDNDGLLSQGVRGKQLTWMDAKVGDWVVTPRHGKPVEVNGLWINALRIAEWLCQELGLESSRFGDAAEQAEASFEGKFWNDHLGFYLDTADPDDGSLRPNQLIAMSLPFGPAKGPNATKALRRITEELLTPYGLRTLSPNESGYRGRFKGPLPELDSAYHQGTVWPWLLGPYCDAVMRLNNDADAVQAALAQVPEMLEHYGVGGIAEVYDGDAPHTPGGCPWQAWSVAEIRRVWKAYVEK